MRADRRRFMSMAIGTAVTCSLPGLSAPALAKGTRAQVYSGPVYGTQWRLVLGADKNPDPALKLIAKILNEIDTSISPFRNDSTLSRFNRADSLVLTNVNPALSELIRTSLSVAKESNGAFDPTVGPLVNKFGFGPIKGDANCSYRDIHCTEDTLQKNKTGVTLDLCGLGKGYAVDSVTQCLQQLGYQNFLFDIGGEIAGIGHHPGGRAWQVAVEPSSDAYALDTRTKLTNASIATSGLQHNHFSHHGKTYGHLVNGPNATPAEPQCHSVSVIHTSATLADAWSTALFVAGPERGVEIAQRHRLHTFFSAVNGVQENSISTGLFFTESARE